MHLSRRGRQSIFYWGLGITLVLLVVGWAVNSAHTLTLPGGRLIALSRLFGLLATYCILLEVLLMSRTPYFEENFDLQEMVDLHRWNGYGILASISAHTVFVTMGYAAPGHVGLWHQFLLLNTSYQDVFKATAGTIIFFVATFLSLRVARKYVPYELWFYMHLTLYAAILLTTLHQLATGGDFINHYWFTAYWYMWYIGVFGVLLWYRILRVGALTWRYDFRVRAVTKEAEQIYSVYVDGNHIERFTFKPGQYATWRIITPKLWWQAHPFSFSSNPGDNTLRFTAKVFGSYTAELKQLQRGARVFIDGPRGSFTADRAANTDNVLLIAGGIGITPYMPMIRALLAKGKGVTLLYAARNPEQVSFARELAALQRQGLRAAFYLDNVSGNINEAILKPYLSPGILVYMCGPDAMTRSLARQLRSLGVSKHSLVTERFAY